MGNICRQEVGGMTLNQDAWRHGQVLQVDNVVFEVVVNPPTVEKVSYTAQFPTRAGNNGVFEVVVKPPQWKG
jgi:hypothetical protein